VLQGEDNEKYLHRSISGEYLYAGSIFLDSKCSRSFRAYNTILYGHNMRDGSMFAKLKDYRDPEIYKSCPYFWIFTPQKDLLYRICSIHPEGVGGSSFIIRFGSGKELEEWRQKVREQSEVETGWEPNPEDRIVTLSTCTEDRGTRYTVQGVLVYEENQGGQRGDG
jgi:sortase B